MISSLVNLSGKRHQLSRGNAGTDVRSAGATGSFAAPIRDVPCREASTTEASQTQEEFAVPTLQQQPAKEALRISALPTRESAARVARGAASPETHEAIESTAHDTAGTTCCNCDEGCIRHCVGSGTSIALPARSPIVPSQPASIWVPGLTVLALSNALEPETPPPIH